MWTFRAMDTDVSVAAPGLTTTAEEMLAREVEAIFTDAERRFSRFRPDSELERLHRATGAVVVSTPMLEVLTAARRHVDATGGLFDPTIRTALEAAGYDRGRAGGPLDRDERGAPVPPAGFDELAIDPETHTVFRPPRVRLDLGGIVKGWTVDRAAALLPSPGFVDAGGDARLEGDGPDGTGWEIEVEDPADPRRTVVTLRVRDRAIATSAPNRRRWRAGGGIAHHLIDPRTGAPAEGDLAQATAVAATAEDADVLAKVAFLLGADRGARFLDERGVAGVLIGRDGSVHLVGDLEVCDG